MTVFKNIFYILCTTKHDDFTRVFRLFTTVNVWQTSFVEPIVGNIFDRQNVQINAEGTRDRKKAWENSNTVCLSLSLSLSLFFQSLSIRAMRYAALLSGANRFWIVFYVYGESFSSRHWIRTLVLLLLSWCVDKLVNYRIKSFSYW